MSLLPSSSAVSECMARLREEKTAALPDPFRAAVAAASIRWEAELLLDLEDFKKAGGFVGFQDDILEYVGLRKGTGPHYKFKYPRGTPFVCNTEHTVTGPLSRSDLPPAQQELLRRREALSRRE